MSPCGIEATLAILLFYFENMERKRGGLVEFPKGFSLSNLQRARKEQREKNIASQDDLAAQDRERLCSAAKSAIKYDLDQFSYYPHEHLTDETKLKLVLELMERFDGRVFGVKPIGESWTGLEHEYEPSFLLREAKICTSYIILLKE